MVKNCDRGLENTARGRRPPKHFHLPKDKGDLKASKQTLKYYFY